MQKLKDINWKNIGIRLASGLVLLGIVITSGIFGGIAWFVVVAFLSLFGLFEFYRVFQIHKSPEGIIGYLVGAGFWAILWFQKYEFIPYLFFAALILLMGVYVLRFEKTDSRKAMASFFGLIYPLAMMSTLYLIRNHHDGNLILWYVLLGAWGADLFAFIFGTLFGKHKMAPVLSPKKTWEGAIGGLIGAALLGGVYGGIMAEHFTMIENPILLSAVFTGVSGAVSIFGDLTASAFKRNHNVKDYSKLIPGHGGVMDRFDSVIFVAPAVFILACLFVK
ncbi:MAG: phosphatidate cytidylyltransferase [Lachnospiraceae bacterium]|nr:phosphatidate cytidylyltransferase [Lachnospiraceae bacterium]